MRSIYAGRDRSWWAARYRGEGPGPLRILIPTCRFSTFVRHSAADLARAFQSAGHEARLLMEPDVHSHLSSVAYLRMMAEFRPDLVVLINYTRANLGPEVLPEVPFVCWVQDAMPHQFNAGVGARQTGLDFLVGHVHDELVRHFGYPPAQTARMSMIASEEKFHDGLVEPALAARLGCELAMVTHHSEPPRALHERLLHEARRELPVVRIFQALWPELENILREPMAHETGAALRAAAAQAARAVLGTEPDQRLLALISRQYCLPVADRIFRHQTLEWAADIARRRAWRLRIYGRGWERHPVFGEFAAGELAHGEELRAAYRCAAVQLHASINWPLHQRVMECALSGGLPLCRLKADDLANWLWTLLRRRVRNEEPGARHGADGEPLLGYVAADDAESMAYAAQRQRLGMEAGAIDWVTQAHSEWIRREPEAEVYRGTVLLGDLAETTFSTAPGLETLVQRAVERPAWRSDLSRGIAARVRHAHTSAVFVRRVLELVTRRLTEARPDAPG